MGTSDPLHGDESSPSNERAGQSLQTESTRTDYLGRLGALIVLPWQDDEPSDPSVRPTNPIDISPLVDILDSHSSDIHQLELLSYAGHSGQHHLLFPHVKTLESRPQSVSTQQRLTDFAGDTSGQSLTDWHCNALANRDILGNPAEAAQMGGFVDTVADELSGLLPDTYGVEIVSADLSPLGHTPLPTHRFLLEENHEEVNFLRSGPNRLAETVRELARMRKPHVIQTIIQNASQHNKYIVTLRVCVLDPTHAIEDHDDLKRHIGAGLQFDLSQIWTNLGLKSNFDLPIEDFYQVTKNWDGTVRWLFEDERKYMEQSDTRTATKLYKGYSEFDKLRLGRSGSNKLYEKLLGHPRMPLFESSLPHVFAVVPMYYDKSPWGQWRDPIATQTIDIETPAEGTRQSITIDSDAAASTTRTLGGNYGSLGHDTMVEYVVRILGEQGRDAWKQEQSGDSVPDGVYLDDGSQAHIEVETDPKRQPSKVLANYARALHEDVSVLFVPATTDKASAYERNQQHTTSFERLAHRIFDLLEEPYREHTDRGTLLYTTTQELRTTDGARPVLPQSASESKWYLRHDGTLQLVADGAVLAEGDAQQLLGTLDYSYRAVETDDGYQILDETGNPVADYQHRQRLTENYTFVHPPHVPMHFHYLEGASVKYKSNKGLTDLRRTPDWVRRDGTRERYEGAVSEFVDRYLVTANGAELLYESFRERFVHWYRTISNAEPPGAKEIGIVAPWDSKDDFKRRSVEGTQKRFLKDRTWAIPPGLVSPNLPFVDPDDNDGD